MNIIPLKLIKDAIQAVPSVKYALGIAGIVSAIALIGGSLKVDYRIAAFGSIVMLVLMVVLVVFAKLSTLEGSYFKYPAIAFVWFSLVITMSVSLLLFMSVFFQWPLNLLHWLGPIPYAQNGKSEIISEIIISGEVRDGEDNKLIKDKRITITIDGYDFETVSKNDGKFKATLHGVTSKVITLRATHREYHSYCIDREITSENENFIIILKRRSK